MMPESNAKQKRGRKALRDYWCACWHQQNLKLESHAQGARKSLEITTVSRVLLENVPKFGDQAAQRSIEGSPAMVLL